MKETHVWALLIVCATVVALGITGCQFHTTRNAMQNGYCEVQDVNQRGTHWAKCDSR